MVSLTGLILIVGTWLGLVVMARRRVSPLPTETGWPLAVALGSVAWGGAATVITEVLSAVRQLNLGGVLAAWLVLATAVVLALRRVRTPAMAATTKEHRNAAATRLPRFWIAGLAVVGVVHAAVAVQGLLTAPTAWDSLTYHLPRVVHWLQNAAVTHFPTMDTRQVESGPWPAFIQAHLHLVWAGDRLAPLVQWAALGISAAAAAGLAARLGGWGRGEIAGPGRADLVRAALLAAVLVLTLPAGITQASTPLTDLVVAGWTLVAALLGAELIRRPASRGLALGFGGALGLALLSKGSALLLTAPVAFIGVGLSLRGLPDARRRVRCLAWVAAAGGLLTLPHLVRNTRVFGSPLGSAYVRSVTAIPAVSAGAAWSGVVRNLALHTASGFAPLTTALNASLAGAHRWSNRDLNDPATTSPGSQFAFITGFPVNDTQTGCFAHFLLAGLAAATLSFRRMPGRHVLAVPLIGGATAFLLVCLLLRWSPWHVRFHLPSLMLACPVIAWVAVAAWPRWTPSAILAGMALLAAWCVLKNTSMPLLPSAELFFQPRSQQMLRSVRNLHPPTAEVAEAIVASGVARVGIRPRHDFFALLDEAEYPLWTALRERGFAGRIFHFDVTNRTAALNSASADVEVSVAFGAGPVTPGFASLPVWTAHPPYTLHWSESASRWAQVTLLTADGAITMPREHGSIPLAMGQATLGIQTAQPGWLHLAAAPEAPPGMPHGSLAAQTASGWVTNLTVGSTEVAFSLPLPAGATLVRLVASAATGGQGAVALNGVRWNWEVSSAPAPWAVIRRLRRHEREGPAEVLGRPGDRSAFDLVAGRDGPLEVVVRLAITPPSPGSPPVLRMTSTAGPEAVERQAEGQVSFPLRVRRGTNVIVLERSALDRGPAGEAAVRIEAVLPRF
ncbi:MAG: hypothetical protein ACKVYV_03190 [Limisphaerales bacterium]